MSNGDKDYWKGVDLGDVLPEFDQCKEEINEAIVSFQQGVTDYFKGDKRLEYSEERCTYDKHYEGGVNFADFLNSTQSNMCVDGIDN